MDKRFLHKVLGQIVYETRIDYDEERIFTPFLPHSPSLNFFPPYDILKPPLPLVPLLLRLLRRHCREVYGLNDEESDYVWKEYKEFIKDKINNEL